MTVAHTSRMTVVKHAGPHRTALLDGFEEPINFGVHGGIRAFYGKKYGKDLGGPDYPATLDHVIAGIAGWLTGTFAGALEARQINTAENITAQVEGDVEEVDGVLKITKIRLVFRGVIPKGMRDKVDKILGFFAKACPAYQSVKGCIDCSWTAELTESG